MAHGGGDGDLASISGTGVVDDEECTGLEPFFYDEAEAVADHERRLRREQEEAREKARRQKRIEADRAVKDSILDHDPKQGGKYFTRYSVADFSEFDIDEESPLVSSDVGFPINVYGTVIARDSIDHKCVYLFRRDRDHCQLINSEDESLIMTGPKRGIASIDDTYVEIDLKIKDHREQKDKELSKGYVSIRGARRQLDKYVLESRSLDTRLSTVEVMYVVVKAAVEATIAFEVLEGDFYGEITASLASFEGNSMVLHDSSKVVDVISGEGKRVIQLLRSIVAVYLEDILSLTIASQTGDGKATRTIDFTPRINGADEDEISVGVSKMRVKVSWSIIGL
ncbi:hypothetical protein ACP70R_034963 [Stipagrostis hirtigluma subsp. patula]